MGRGEKAANEELSSSHTDSTQNSLGLWCMHATGSGTQRSWVSSSGKQQPGRRGAETNVLKGHCEISPGTGLRDWGQGAWRGKRLHSSPWLP